MSVENNALIINCQGHHLASSGGAARYCRELVGRIERVGFSEQLPGVECYVENFITTDDAASASASFPTRWSFAGRVKHSVATWCPPPLLDYLGKRRCKSAISSDSLVQDAGSWPVRWRRSSSQSLLHELTNYTIINESARVSRDRNLTLAVTFLDIQDYYYPNYFTDKTLNQRRLLYSYFKDRFEVFFAISQFTKDSMVEHLGISPERITVTHLAADVEWNSEGDVNSKGRVKGLGRYLIYPAKLWPHKNHDFLLSALHKVKDSLVRAGLSLVLTGGFSLQETEKLEKKISEYSLEELVRVLGFVSDMELKELLKNAEFLLFPSLFEGFGMPLLEAMSLGCPVISSTAGALPEIGGCAPIYFDPKSEEELIAVLKQVMCGVGIDRADMIRKGLKNCERFSWEKTFSKTLSVYRDIL